MKNFSLKQDLSLLFWIIDSKAQSPVPGLDDPCFKLTPCLHPLAIALEIIRDFSFPNKCLMATSAVGVAWWEESLFLLLLGILSSVRSEMKIEFNQV
jgi:hypothetical protein